MLGWVIGAMVGWAGIPADVQIRPVAATRDDVARFERWQVERVRASSAALCQPLAIPEVQLCFRVWEGRRRRWVTEADGARWGVSARDLEERVLGDCVESVSRAEVRTVQGGAARYLALTDGDGRAVSGFLCPGALTERVSVLGHGVGIRAALPTQDVLLAWPAGDPELDRIMAVAAREIFELQSDPLTPQIMLHDGDRWRAFGRALPR